MNGRYVRLLGAPRVESGNSDMPRFRSQRTVALLGYLAAERRPVARDFLSALFWPDELAPTARTNLRRELHNLSRILPDCWETDRLAVQFTPNAHTAVDLFDFQEFEQSGQWVAAAAIVRGHFLEGLALADNAEVESWLLSERERWRERAERVMTRVIHTYTQQANFDAALEMAHQLLQLAPWHEETHRHMMRLLAWTDQRAAALRQYQLCVDILETELDVPPDPETTRLFGEIREGKLATAPMASLSWAIAGPFLPRHNLPAQTTRFIGRDRELAEIRRLLDDPTLRLLTIFGAGGMGKSRLALAAAQQYIETRGARVGFVDLASLAPGDDMIPAIAEAVGYPFQQDTRSSKQQLLDYVRTKQLLLLLDNFEHLLGQVGLVQEILQAGPQVKVLVTSRERLQLSGETVFALAGMAFPALDTAADAQNYHAVQLFVLGANRLRSGLIFENEELAAVTNICRLVHGMPLAILLAAAWIDLLSPPEIAEEIANSLAFLETDLHDVPDRQRSIYAVFEQSWQRLTTVERTVFMRLAIFRGGFTREAAQIVAGASLKLLSSLVNKALLQPQRNGRYSLHELLRQYAEAKLVANSQVEEASTAHGTYYANFMQQRAVDLKGPRQLAALDEIEADLENVRAAWHWAVQECNYAAIDQALESLIWFCYIRNRFEECRELLCVAREQLAPKSGHPPHPVWGRVLAGAIRPPLSYVEYFSEPRSQVAAGLAIGNTHNNYADIAFCLWRLGVVTYSEGNLEETLDYFQQSLAYYHSLADDFYLSYLLKDLTHLYIRLEKPDKAMTALEQSIALHRKLGNWVGLASALGSMGWLAYYDARYDEAEAQWEEVQQIAGQFGNRRLRLWNLIGHGWLALFSKGDLLAAQGIAEEMRTIALEQNDRECQQRAQVLFGILAGLNEDYLACRQTLPDEANRHRFPANRVWELIGLCLAACGLDDGQAAQQLLQQLLELSHIYHWPSNYAIALPFAAILADSADQPEQAAELLGLAYHHPLSPKGWLRCWPLLARLKAELKSGLGPATFEAAWARGTALDLEATAETLLAELKAVHPPKTIVGS